MQANQNSAFLIIRLWKKRWFRWASYCAITFLLIIFAIVMTEWRNIQNYKAHITELKTEIRALGYPTDWEEFQAYHEKQGEQIKKNGVDCIQKAAAFYHSLSELSSQSPTGNPEDEKAITLIRTNDLNDHRLYGKFIFHTSQKAKTNLQLFRFFINKNKQCLTELEKLKNISEFYYPLPKPMTVLSFRSPTGYDTKQHQRLMNLVLMASYVSACDNQTDLSTQFMQVFAKLQKAEHDLLFHNYLRYNPLDPLCFYALSNTQQAEFSKEQLQLLRKFIRQDYRHSTLLTATLSLTFWQQIFHSKETLVKTTGIPWWSPQLNLFYYGSGIWRARRNSLITFLDLYDKLYKNPLYGYQVTFETYQARGEPANKLEAILNDIADYLKLHKAIFNEERLYYKISEGDMFAGFIRERNAQNFIDTYLAIRLYEADNHSLPDSLEQLREKKYLLEIPQDYYSGKRILFLKNRKSITLHSDIPDKQGSDTGGAGSLSFTYPPEENE